MNANITIEPQTKGKQIVYEYGVRIAKVSEPGIADQIQKARRTYNNIIKLMRDIYDESKISLWNAQEKRPWRCKRKWKR